MKQVMLRQKESYNDLENIIERNLSKIFGLDLKQEKLQNFFLNLEQDLKESSIIINKNYEKEVDKVLEKIENHKKLEVQNFVDKLNYVGTEGESIISFILRNSDFNLKNEICSQDLQKQKVSNDVKITINSAMSYTEMPIEDIQELIGHVFDNNINEFGVY